MHQRGVGPYPKTIVFYTDDPALTPGMPVAEPDIGVVERKGAARHDIP